MAQSESYTTIRGQRAQDVVIEYNGQQHQGRMQVQVMGRTGTLPSW